MIHQAGTSPNLLSKVKTREKQNYSIKNYTTKVKNRRIARKTKGFEARFLTEKRGEKTAVKGFLRFK